MGLKHHYILFTSRDKVKMEKASLSIPSDFFEEHGVALWIFLYSLNKEDADLKKSPITSQREVIGDRE